MRQASHEHCPSHGLTHPSHTPIFSFAVASNISSHVKACLFPCGARLRPCEPRCQAWVEQAWAEQLFTEV